AKLNALAPTTRIGPYGSAAVWQSACAAAATQDPSSARQFFESQFVPMQVRADRRQDGLFTGYYEPELGGARARTEAFKVPLPARPADLVSVDLGLFRPTLKGQRIAGHVSDNGRLVPYANRRQIEAEASNGPTPLRKPIVWVDDPVDAFFMEVQGS